MVLIIDQPELATTAAVSDRPSALIEPVEDDGIEVLPDACGVPHDPPSELLLTAASVVVWVGLAVVVRRLLARRHARA